MGEHAFSQFKEKSDKAFGYLKEKLGTIRSGRANPAFVSDIKVNCYGSMMPLKSVAAISVPESRMIVIQPWDQSVVSAVEKAILTSHLGLTPQTEDNVVRVIIPALTSERREEMIKLVGQEVEKVRISIRNFRHEALDEMKQMKDEKEISEDDERRSKDELQKILDTIMDDIDLLKKNKEAELQEV